MRSLLFLILAGYAVRCDDASYYVIEMPEEAKEYTKPFRVYWNVPTMQCKSKKIPFENLDRFGIIQNSGDSFRGDKVAILYDPGQFPALLKNETSGKFVFRNGGVPQEGNLEQHLKAFRTAVEQSIPDQKFSGIGIIDFESWRPVFRQNFGVLVPYKDISYQIERKLHWFWSERAIQARARQRFEEAARAFMQTTISVAKQMRPKALWGYYGFPYCFNMATNHMVQSCADKVGTENDRIYWLWSESTALYPSIYSSKELTSSQLAGMVRGRVAEAARVKRRGTPVLPYFWFRYREGDYLSQTDLALVLDTLYKSDASGLIIWGSSNDVNTVDKCNKLLRYTEDVMGPAIAKYTKGYHRNTTDNSDTTSNPVSTLFGLTTWRPILKNHNNNSNSSKQPYLDPDYSWVPPENYTQDIVHYVEQELRKKPDYNVKNDTEGDQTELHVKKNELLDMILNIFKYDKELRENSTVQTIDSGTTTVKNYYMPNVVTKNPLDGIISKASSDNSEQIISHSTEYFSSTAKLNNYVTPDPSLTTSEVIAITEKNNDSSEIIFYGNSTAFDSQENSIAERSTNNINREHSTITPDSSTLINNLDNITETNSYTGDDEVTKTSQEFTNVPLNYDLEDNSSTFKESLNDSTTNFPDDVTTSDRPKSILEVSSANSEQQKDNSSKSDKKGYHIAWESDDIISSETSTLDSRSVEITTKSYTLDSTTTEIVYELKNSTDESDYLKATTNREDISQPTNQLSTVPVEESDISSTNANLRKNYEYSNPESSTNTNTESTVRSIDETTKSTTEFVDITNREDSLDNLNENFSTETTTADGVSTTDAVPQVVVFL